MAIRRGRIHWYDIVLFGLAAAIVYPDKILEWLSERTGRALGWLHLILIEVIAIVLMIVAMVLLMPVYPKLEWWHPALYVGMLAAVRAVMWCVSQMFGFDD
jgi:hypothetical protein